MRTFKDLLEAIRKAPLIGVDMDSKVDSDFRAVVTKNSRKNEGQYRVTHVRKTGEGYYPPNTPVAHDSHGSMKDAVMSARKKGYHPTKFLRGKVTEATEKLKKKEPPKKKEEPKETLVTASNRGSLWSEWVLNELSKATLKSYRSEAQMSSVPTDKELKTYDLTADDYGEKAKRHSRGVKTASAKIAQKTKEEQKAAKSARIERGSNPDRVAAAQARKDAWVKNNPEKVKQYHTNEEVMKTFKEFMELGDQASTDAMVAATPEMKIEIIKTDDDPHPMDNSETFDTKDELVKRLRAQ